MRILLTLLFFLTIGVPTAKACRCVVGDVKTEFNRTDVIVHGKVLSKTIVSYSNTLTTEKLKAFREEYKSDSLKLATLDSESLIKIELEVIELYKGKKLNKKIVVYTHWSSTACGFTGFKVGDEFLTYMYFKPAHESDETNSNQELWTNSCMRTKKFDKSEHEKLCELING